MKLFLAGAGMGALAGAVSGFLGAGGGMVLVPLLELLLAEDPGQVFPSSLAVMAPITLVSLLFSGGPLPWREALPYLLGSGAGGVLAACFQGRIPPVWLHRGLGLLILLGGGRLLWT